MQWLTQPDRPVVKVALRRIGRQMRFTEWVSSLASHQRHKTSHAALASREVIPKPATVLHRQ